MGVGVLGDWGVHGGFDGDVWLESGIMGWICDTLGGSIRDCGVWVLGGRDSKVVGEGRWTTQILT